MGPCMFAGSIEGVGPRYCPSIEDKVVRFADKDSHQIFIEPEGLTSNEVYPNGISTSLPFDVQWELVRSMRGFENARITRPGYAIEYDYFGPRDLDTDVAKVLNADDEERDRALAVLKVRMVWEITNTGQGWFLSHHHHVHVRHIFRIVTGGNRGAHLGQAAGRVGFPEIRSADVVFKVDQNLGDSAHADAADAHEMDMVLFLIHGQTL